MNIPVSYTHLDVYKRQVYYTAFYPNIGSKFLFVKSCLKHNVVLTTTKHLEQQIKIHNNRLCYTLNLIFFTISLHLFLICFILINVKIRFKILFECFLFLK